MATAINNKPETDILLKIIKDEHLFIPLYADKDLLIRLARRHKLIYSLYIFGQKNSGFFNEKQSEIIDNQLRNGALKSLDQLNALKELAQKFSIHNTQYVLVKGPQLSRMLYGHEAIKESVDLDVMLTHEKDMSEADQLIRHLGYNRSSIDRFHGALKQRFFLMAKREVQYKNDVTGITVDLHFRPASGAYLTAPAYRMLFNGIKTVELDNIRIPILSDEAYLVYLCYHAALHRFSRLAWLGDIRTFIRLKKAAIDFEKIFSLASYMRVDRCVWLALILIQDYFSESYDIGRPYVVTSRLKSLTSICRNILYQKSNYAHTLKGRIEKVFYMLMLTRGLWSKIDWLAGIFMRQVLKII